MEKYGLKEKRTHGTAMFPLHIYTQEDSLGKYNLSVHWHEEIELIYVEKGEILFHIDMNTIKVSAGQFIFINSEQLHGANAIDNIPSTHHAIVFDLNILGSSIYDYCQSKYIDPILQRSIEFPQLIDGTSIVGKKLILEMNDIIDAYKNNYIGWELSIKASLLKVISYLAQGDLFIKEDAAKLTSKDYKVQLVKKVLHYIYNHYQEKIYIEDLAKETNMNTQYFCRFFKSITGKTPIDYINHYRIEQAAKILQTENIKVMEVSLNVGFDNFSYFIKKFREIKKCSPSEYRKMNP